MPRFMIELDAGTFEALCTFAEEERRDPPRQAEWMLSQAIASRVKQQEALRRLDGTPMVIMGTEEEA